MESWVMPARAPASDAEGVMRTPSRIMKMFSPEHSEIRPSGPSMSASSKPARRASTLARPELMYMPVALAAVGMAFGSCRRHDEVMRRAPLAAPSSPRYAPQVHVAIARRTGEVKGKIPVSP